MSYTTPTGNEADFELQLYTAPLGNNANFELGVTASVITEIDWNNSNMQKCEIGISVVEFEFVNPRNVGRFDLRIKNDIGSLSLTFPSNVVWIQEEPDWSEMEINEETIVVFLYDGEYYYAEALPFYEVNL